MMPLCHKFHFIYSCVHINGLCEMGVSIVELWNVVLAAKQNLLKELVSGDLHFFKMSLKSVLLYVR